MGDKPNRFREKFNKLEGMTPKPNEYLDAGKEEDNQNGTDKFKGEFEAIKEEVIGLKIEFAAENLNKLKKYISDIDGKETIEKNQIDKVKKDIESVKQEEERNKREKKEELIKELEELRSQIAELEIQFALEEFEVVKEELNKINENNISKDVIEGIKKDIENIKNIDDKMKQEQSNEGEQNKQENRINEKVKKVVVEIPSRISKKYGINTVEKREQKRQTYYLAVTTINEIRDVAGKLGMSASSLVQKLLEQGIEDIKKDL